MESIYNSLFGSLTISDDMKAMLIMFLFIFIISTTTEIIVTVKGLGSK